MPISSSCCGCSPATSRRSCSRARSIRIRRSPRAGCAPRTASSTRSCRRRTGPITPTTSKQPLKPGQAVELDIEIWPTSIVVPAGYRIGLTIRGKDYEYGGASGGKLSNFKNELTGCGPFLHDDPRDRPPEIFDGTTTLHFSRTQAPYLLLPVIPAAKPRRARNQGPQVTHRIFVPLRPCAAYRADDSAVSAPQDGMNRHSPWGGMAGMNRQLLADPDLQRHFLRRAAVSARQPACR